MHGSASSPVRADADGHEHIGLDGSRLVLCIGWLLVPRRLRITKLLIVTLQQGQHLGRASNDPYRFAAPLHDPEGP
jgi:hypothetical protein